MTLNWREIEELLGNLSGVTQHLDNIQSSMGNLEVMGDIRDALCDIRDMMQDDRGIERRKPDPWKSKPLPDLAEKLFPSVPEPKAKPVKTVTGEKKPLKRLKKRG